MNGEVYTQIVVETPRVEAAGAPLRFDFAADGLPLTEDNFSGSSSSSVVALDQGIVSPITRSVNIAVTPEYSRVTPCTLVSTLTVTDRPSQTVVLNQTFDLVWNETLESFVVSNITGTSSGQGTIDGSLWRVTFSITSIVGTATGVTITGSFTTTTQPTVITGKYMIIGALDAAPFDNASDIYTGPNTILALFDSNGQLGSNIDIYTNDTFATIKAAIEAQGTGTVTITSESSTAARITFDLSTTVEARDELGAGATPAFPMTVTSIVSIPKNASYAAQLDADGTDMAFHFFLRRYNESEGFFVTSENSPGLFVVGATDVTLLIPPDAEDEAGEDEYAISLASIQNTTLYYRFDFVDPQQDYVLRRHQGDIHYPQTEGPV